MSPSETANISANHLHIGIFVAQIDGSILMANHSTIASEFDALKSSSWLITSFTLAGAATQTLVSIMLLCFLVPEGS